MSTRYLKNSKEFGIVYKKGRSCVDEILVVKIYKTELTTVRFGLVVSKRVGNSVVRNKVRRRLKTIIQEMSIKGTYDIVIIARHNISRVSYSSMYKSLEKLLIQSGALKAGNF